MRAPVASCCHLWGAPTARPTAMAGGDGYDAGARSQWRVAGPAATVWPTIVRSRTGACARLACWSQSTQRYWPRHSLLPKVPFSCGVRARACICPGARRADEQRAVGEGASFAIWLTLAARRSEHLWFTLTSTIFRTHIFSHLICLSTSRIPAHLRSTNKNTRHARSLPLHLPARTHTHNSQH